MKNSPFRERRLAPSEVRRVLRRAIDLEEADGSQAASMTLQELHRLAGEVGLSARSVDAAAEETPESESEGVAEMNPGLWGGPSLLRAEATVDGVMDDALKEDVVELIRERVGVGQVDHLRNTMTWRPLSHAGQTPRMVSINLRSKDGRTRVLIEEHLLPLTLGIWLGLGVGVGVGVGVPLLVLTLLRGWGWSAAVVFAAFVLLVLYCSRQLVHSIAVRRNQSLQSWRRAIVAELHRRQPPRGDSVVAEQAAEQAALAEEQAEEPAAAPLSRHRQ